MNERINPSVLFMIRIDPEGKDCMPAISFVELINRIPYQDT
jgi:hypothetical protein